MQWLRGQDADKSKSIRCHPLMIWMMMPIDPNKCLFTHPQKAACLPSRNASVHQPRGTCVPKCVRCHFFQASLHTSRSKGFLNVFDGAAIVANNRPQVRTVSTGTTKVAQQFRVQWIFSPSLLGNGAAFRVPINNTLFEINLRPTQRQDRLFAFSCVEAQQNKQRQVPPALARIPRRTKQASGFASAQPSCF